MTHTYTHTEMSVCKLSFLDATQNKTIIRSTLACDPDSSQKIREEVPYEEQHIEGKSNDSFSQDH